MHASVACFFVCFSPLSPVCDRNSDSLLVATVEQKYCFVHEHGDDDDDDHHPQASGDKGTGAVAVVPG